MKKIAILGAGGLLGSEATVFFRDAGYEVIAIDNSSLDVTNVVEVKIFLDDTKPDAVINCAAFTNVNACETQEGKKQAMMVNGQAPIDLIEKCLERNIACIHISTDYCFGDSKKSGHIESDVPEKPMNIYGESKLKAEKGIIELCGGLEDSNFRNDNSKIYIIRISWLFGKNATNFVQKIINKSEEVEELKVVDDETGCPTYTRDVVKVMKVLLEESIPPGIFHVASNESCSRYEFAKYILEKINSKVEISPCSLDDFKRDANIPEFSILRNTKLTPNNRHWRAMIDDFFKC